LEFDAETQSQYYNLETQTFEIREKLWIFLMNIVKKF
jgi:hypothetical protein